ncbi:hypothetical protein MTO96_027678 [Rhipicephalus appendiculatus]
MTELQGQKHGTAGADLSRADAALGRKDSLVVLRKRMQEKDVNESSHININAALGVAATLLLTVLLIIYIVAGGKHEAPSTPKGRNAR